ncbi:NADH:ubiquinone oxidoreductase [Basidiobolus ranarum]|uniref:NADH:ubiquinone oxidoreductase n=1 Tax=Basidiobolus ranarum TaxID=34480 RepID=A0ABR2WUQ4_9FUNG
MSELSISTSHEDISYWRNMSLSLEKELTDTRITLDDFQVSSRELEEELERELQVLEVENTKLKTHNQSLLFELETLTQKHQTTSLNSNDNILSLQKEIEILREGYERIQRRAVNLEMDNEELENFKRVAHSSLSDMEVKYNEAREWKTKFERETTKRNQMKEEIQRLKDELADLENELCVIRSHSPISPALSPTPSNSPSSLTSTRSTCTEENPPDFTSQSQSPTPPSPLPTVRRLSEYRRKEGRPIVMLHEIMDRVKVLENRLISCRSKVKPLLPNSRTNSNTSKQVVSSKMDINSKSH